MHPLHNFCIISYDPRDLPPEARREIRAAKLMPEPPLERGDRVHLVRGWVCRGFVLEVEGWRCADGGGASYSQLRDRVFYLLCACVTAPLL